MPAKKTGSFHSCVICGKPRWRRPSDVRRNIRQTCSRECLSKFMSGAGNPFWGRSHGPETLARISETKRARPVRQRTGPPKGYRHSPEARAKMSAALKERWRVNRDKMISHLPRGEDHHFRKRGHQPRHRSNFSPLHLRDWKDSRCAWCQATEGLVLDHIIPVMAGGKNERANAQTLCRPCNIWKMWFVDRPIYLAGLGSKPG